MKAFSVLLAVATSVKAQFQYEFGDYRCTNNCAPKGKYGMVVGSGHAAGMPNVTVFGAFHGNMV